MNFDQSFEMVIGHEGGYVNNQSDTGGETKFGISKRAYPTANIASLTLDQAKAIYLQDYWNKLQLDALPDAIRLDMFDTAVNSGVNTAVKLLQRACKVNDDGIIGPVTLAAANRINADVLDKRLSGHRLMYICSLDTFPTFGKGWTRRIASNLIGD